MEPGRLPPEENEQSAEHGEQDKGEVDQQHDVGR